MNGPASRRGFLRGLTTLPLIGGGVTLIGVPSAVAEPVTGYLLDAYDEFLDAERRALKWERYGSNPPAGDQRPFGRDIVLYDRTTKQAFDYVSAVTPGARFHSFERHQGPNSASSRAALVLAAVGCDWREDRR